MIEAPKEWEPQEEEAKDKFVDPPRELPNRSYSLEPDMANGWRPKRAVKTNFANVFSINYNESLVDEIIKELYKRKNNNKDKLVYLGTAFFIKALGGITHTSCMKIGLIRILILLRRS